MDPIKSGLSIYEAGGLALLLIFVGVIGCALMGRWFMNEITKMRGEIQALLVGVIKENSLACQNLQGEVKFQTSVIVAQTEVMRGRPCLIESGVHQRPVLPRHDTPRPHERDTK